MRESGKRRQGRGTKVGEQEMRVTWKEGEVGRFGENEEL